LFLREQILYASSVEQMSAVRAVQIYDASDPAAKAFASLWREVSAHLTQLPQTGVAPMATPAVYADTLDALLSTLIVDAQVHASPSAQSAARIGPDERTDATDRKLRSPSMAKTFQVLECVRRCASALCRELSRAHFRH
jgi:hypothetical protein